MSFTIEQLPPRELQRGMSERDYIRMVFPVWKRARIWLRDRLSYLLWLAHVLKLCLRNLAGHIEILLSKNEYDYGLLAEEGHRGVLCWNRRTCARVAGIQELTSLYPWASSIEEQIFLAGFDKGEQFALHLADTPLVEIPPSTWIDPTTSAKREHPA
jgi:hypothetical protein